MADIPESRPCTRCAIPIRVNSRGRPRIYCEPCAGDAATEKAAEWRRRYKGKEHEIPRRNRSDEMTKRQRVAAEAQQSRERSQRVGCRVCGAPLSGMQTLYCGAKCCNYV